MGAVDVNRNMDLSHFRLAPNLSFREVDVTSTGAGAALSAGLRADCAGSATVLVGMHLCGALSTHAARLFSEWAPAPAALVLAPCCLDGRRPQVKLKAKRLRVDPHLFWCLTLLFSSLPAA